MCLVGAAPNAALAQDGLTDLGGDIHASAEGRAVHTSKSTAKDVVKPGGVDGSPHPGLDSAGRGNHRRTLLADDVVRVIASAGIPIAKGCYLVFSEDSVAGAVLSGRKPGCGGDSSCSAAQLAVGLKYVPSV